MHGNENSYYKTRAMCTACLLTYRYSRVLCWAAGFSPKRDHIIEIAAADLDSGEEWHTLIKVPERVIALPDTAGLVMHPQQTVVHSQASSHLYTIFGSPCTATHLIEAINV